MIQTLVIHSTTLSNTEYKKRLLKKHPFLKRHAKTWRVCVMQLGANMPKREFDKVWYDVDTVNVRDIADHVLNNRKGVGIAPISLKNNQKMKINLVKPVLKLEEK